MKTIRVMAPATVANVAAGFDILGFALEQPGDVLEMSLRSDHKIVIKNEATDVFPNMPLEPIQNTAGVAVMSFLESIGEQAGVTITIKEKIRPGSGMGSSAASAAAAVFGMNHLLGNPLSTKDLVRFAMEGERVACGTAHADNVGPSLLGNVVLVRSYTPLDIIEIPAPKLSVSVIHPQIEVRTEDARNILRKEIQLKDAIVQWGNTAGLIAGLMKNDVNLIGRSLNDVIIEPIRSLLIPGFQDAKKAAMDSGALGCSISGSGPSMFALSTDTGKAQNIVNSMERVFTVLGIDVLTYVSQINTHGPTLKEIQS